MARIAGKVTAQMTQRVTNLYTKTAARVTLKIRTGRTAQNKCYAGINLNLTVRRALRSKVACLNLIFKCSYDILGNGILDLYFSMY